jgi:hypothetical protein
MQVELNMPRTFACENCQKLDFLPENCCSKSRSTCARQVVKFFFEFKAFIEKQANRRNEESLERRQTGFGGTSENQRLHFQKLKEFNFGIVVGQRSKDGLLVRFQFKDKV